MGSARHRSWSHTRGKLASDCPRALYFQYYPWGDEKQNIARFLKRAATPESLAGTIVHRHIAIGLRQLVRRKTYPVDLHKSGLAQFADSLEESKGLANSVRAGRRPYDQGTVLFHHLYGNDDTQGEEKGREAIEAALKNFETSPVLQFLKDTNYDRWYPILTSTDDVPSFVASEKLGFRSAIGLRIYAAYDLAIRWGDDALLIDWKVGRRTPFGEATARRQLAVYALWATAKGRSAKNVKTATVWLGQSAPFELLTVDQDTIASVIESIEADDGFERGATRPIADKDGVIVRYDADRDQFPTRPEPRRCGWCPFRSICPEGKAAAKQQDLVQVACESVWCTRNSWTVQNVPITTEDKNFPNCLCPSLNTLNEFSQ